MSRSLGMAYTLKGRGRMLPQSLDKTQFAQGPDAVGARPCPRCGKIMEFRHMLGSFGERPPLQVFRCEACGATDFVPA